MAGREEPSSLSHQGTLPLETVRLRLRRFRLTDSKEMYENWAKDPEVARWMTWRAHANVKITRDCLNAWCSHYRPNFYKWGIVWKETGALIGSIDLMHFNEEAKSADLAYALSRSYWKRGIVPEASRRVLRFAFEEIGLERINGQFDGDNLASGRVMQKLGMQFHQVIPDGYTNNQGILLPVTEYTLTREDFSRCRIIQANRGEEAETAALYEAVIDGLEQIGNPPGWKKGAYPAMDTAVEALEKGNLFSVWKEGRLIGSFILDEEQPEGYTQAVWKFPARKPLVLHTLALHPNEQRKGLSKQILDFIAQFAREHGCDVIRLDVAAGNLPAIRCYTSAGFQCAGKIDLGLGEIGLPEFLAYEKQV